MTNPTPFPDPAALSDDELRAVHDQFDAFLFRVREQLRRRGLIDKRGRIIRNKTRKPDRHNVQSLRDISIAEFYLALERSTSGRKLDQAAKFATQEHFAKPGLRYFRTKAGLMTDERIQQCVRRYRAAWERIRLDMLAVLPSRARAVISQEDAFKAIGDYLIESAMRAIAANRERKRRAIYDPATHPENVVLACADALIRHMEGDTRIAYHIRARKAAEAAQRKGTRRTKKRTN